MPPQRSIQSAVVKHDATLVRGSRGVTVSRSPSGRQGWYWVTFEGTDISKYTWLATIWYIDPIMEERPHDPSADCIKVGIAYGPPPTFKVKLDTVEVMTFGFLLQGAGGGVYSLHRVSQDASFHLIVVP